MPAIRPSTLLAVLCLAGTPFCQYTSWFTDFEGKNTGHTVAGFLTLPVSAGDLSRGLASSPGTQSAADLPYFTANAAFARSALASATHLEWFMGLRNEYAAAVLPISDAGAVGFFSRVFTSDKTTDSRDINEQPTAAWALDYSVGASFSRLFFHDMLAAGISAAYVESRLDNISGRSGVAGIDLLCTPFEYGSVRLRVGNIGPDLTYTSTAEPLPLQAGVSLCAKPLAGLVDLTDRVDADIGLGVSKVADEPLIVGASAEGIFFRHLYARLGYEYSLAAGSPGLAGLSAGAGASIGPYGVEFGWKEESEDFGSVWAVTLNYKGAEIPAKTAIDYYRAAEKKFTGGQYKRAIYYAEKALRLDPKLWQAATLITRANAAMRRRQGLEVALIYTGNTKGAVVPVPGASGSTGGLARQATVVESLRAEYPNNLSIDIGNMVTAKDDTLKVAIIDGYFSRIPYTCLGMGWGELDFGAARLQEKSSSLANRYICSNLKDFAGTGILKKQIVAVDRYRFAVFDVVNPALRTDAANPPQTVDFRDLLSAELTRDDVMRCTARIVVVHDSWENLKAYLAGLPSVNVAICAGSTEPFITPMTAGNAAVLSLGDDGGRAGCCLMRFDESGKLTGIENRLVPLNEEIAPDTAVEELVRRVSMQIALRDEHIDTAAIGKGEGAFVFLSDRIGRAGVYLKVLDRHAEFPLAWGSGVDSLPVASFAEGTVACLENTAESPVPRLWLMSTTGGNKRQIPASRLEDITFTPDGRWLYAGASAAADTTLALSRLARDGTSFLPVVTWKGCSVRWPAFSPDGALMAFASNKEGLWQIYLTNQKGEEPLRITDVPANHSSPLFSPDGNYVVCLTDRTAFNGGSDLWVYDRLKGAERQLTDNAHIHDYVWLSDSRTVLYSTGINILDLNVLDIVSGMSRKLIPGSGPRDYSEISPQVINHRGREIVVYVRQYQNGKRKIFAVNPDGSDDRQIVSDQGNSWLK